jgi:Phage tail tube protein, GTA-gp10
MQNGTYEADWADSHYLFNVAQIDLLLELEEKCKAPFATVYQRLATKSYSITDVRETIRLGLIGGGATPLAALALVQRYIDGGPQRIGLLINAMLALRILQAVLVGVPDDNNVGKKKEEEGAANRSASDAPSSTAPAPPSDSPLASSAR